MVKPLTAPLLTSNRLEFDSATEAIEHYFSQGWTDGPPIGPPTPQLVAQFLEHSARSPSDIVGTEPTKGRVITAGKVAINAAMAGCLPEYFPVVLAVVEAICQPEFNLHAITASTMGAAVLIVVNGPIVSQLGLNSGVSVFGPGHRANATIGRAVRLVVSNATGAVSGVLDKATLGHAGKYTWCIAEAEDVSPWEPLHASRGLRTEQSAVTVFAGLSPIQVSNHEDREPESILASFKDAMFAAGLGQGEIVLVLCPEHIGHIRSVGWTREQVRDALFGIAQRPAEEWVAAGPVARDDRASADAHRGVTLSAEGITLVVAGGPAGAFSAVIPLWGGGSGSVSVTRSIDE